MCVVLVHVDDASAGESDFVDAVGGRDKVLLIGVSCGLSADYVAGALRCALRKGHSVACIGFNPASEARAEWF